MVILVHPILTLKAPFNLFVPPLSDPSILAKQTFYIPLESFIIVVLLNLINLVSASTREIGLLVVDLGGI